MNQKVASFDSTLYGVMEGALKLEPGYGMSSYVPLNGDIHMLELYLNSPFIDDNDIVFKQYDYVLKKFGKELKLPDRPSVWVRDLGIGRGIPFTMQQLFTVSNSKESLFLFETNSEIIAEVDANFDTLRTISVILPTERVTEAERDSIRSSILNDYKDSSLDVSPLWDALKGQLPQSKAPVEEMRIDWKGRFWLKSNLRSKYDQWFVLNQDGNLEKLVNLPRDAHLTHISKHHLGIRLKDHLFGLYESVD